MTSSEANVFALQVYERITEDQVETLIRKLKKPEDARKFLMNMGIIDANGQLAEPYRPIPQEPFPTQRQILQLAEKHGLPQERKTVRFVQEALELWGWTDPGSLVWYDFWADRSQAEGWHPRFFLPRA